VHHYHGCIRVPELDALRLLEDMIDEAVGVKQWIGEETGGQRASTRMR
jgi:hypothetical protein